MITTRFDRTATAAEVIDGIDLSGRRAVVTGAASGIGVETARALAQAGAEVTLAVRDTAAGEAIAADIGSGARVAPLELTDHGSIAAFTDSWDGPLHILVNNAGVMNSPEQRTAEGWELQFATNHLGHFALTLGLHDALAAAGGARIVSVSSLGHRQSPVVFDDIHFERRPYDGWQAYGQSKTANVLFAVEATRRWADDGITANALMPGGIFTNLQRHTDPAMIERWKQAERERDEPRMKSVEQGAATTVLLATAPELEGVGGRYFEDCNEAPVVDDNETAHGVRPYALDPEAARRLWDVSLEMLDS